MAHLLYYWRRDNYLKDLDLGVGFHLNQRSPKMCQILRGESLWAFTRAASGNYVLAAQLVCHQITRNPDTFRYGPHRVWGDLSVSRYFSIEKQKDITSLVRQFDLATGSPTTLLGRAFQGNAAVRTIIGSEHKMLLSWSKGLSLEPRAKLLSEDLLERGRMLLGERYVERLGENISISTARKDYLKHRAGTRRSHIVRELKERYKGRCQLTGWDPRAEYGLDLCEAHHVHWLSRGGDDALHNLVLLSPNIHRLIHRVDAPFDFKEKCFWLKDKPMNIQLCEHQLAPSEGQI